MKFKSQTFYQLLLLSSALLAAPFAKAQGKLDEYIRQGLASNESIRQQKFVLEKNI
jgi:hypothetical protein